MNLFKIYLDKLQGKQRKSYDIESNTEDSNIVFFKTKRQRNKRFSTSCKY